MQLCGQLRNIPPFFFPYCKSEIIYDVKQDYLFQKCNVEWFVAGSKHKNRGMSSQNNTAIRGDHGKPRIPPHPSLAR